MAAWKLGGVSRVSCVVYDSARYVADYIGKSYNGEKAKEVYGNREVPFQLMSKGLGKEFAVANEKQMRQNCGLTVRGVPVGIPRYYARKLDIKVGREAMKHERPSIAPSKVASVWVGPVDDTVLRTGLPRIQREIDAEARNALFKKGSQ